MLEIVEIFDDILVLLCKSSALISSTLKFFLIKFSSKDWIVESFLSTFGICSPSINQSKSVRDNELKNYTY